MDPRQDEQSLDLRGYFDVLRRRKWTIVLAIVVAMGSGLAFSIRQTPVYRSESRVLITPTPSNLYPNVETEAEVAASFPVATVVRDLINFEGTASALLGALDVTATVDTEVLSLKYSSSDPAFAQAAANGFAEGYLEYRQRQGQEAVEAVKRSIQARIDRVEDDLRVVTVGIEEARAEDNVEEVTNLEAERSSLIARLGLLQQEYDDANPDPSLGTEGGEVLESAALPSSPISPNHTQNAALSAFLGLLVGVGAAFLRERLDDRFSGRQDVEGAMGAPVLASVATFTPFKKGQELIILSQPYGPAGEAYRSLRTTLKFVASQRSVKSILITSPSEGEGKTATTANLGVALAQAGQRVVVVSADLRRPTLEKYFNADDHIGLSTWLLNQAQHPSGSEPSDARGFINPTPVPNLSILPTGPIPPNPAELLASPALNALVRELEEHFDIVLIDTAPTLPVADASILASQVGGVIVVIDAGATARSAGEHVKEQLTRVGANVMGTVMNRFVATQTYSYYASKGYASDNAAAASSRDAAVHTSGSLGAEIHGSKRLRRPFLRR